MHPAYARFDGLCGHPVSGVSNGHGQGFGTDPGGIEANSGLVFSQAHARRLDAFRSLEGILHPRDASGAVQALQRKGQGTGLRAAGGTHGVAGPLAVSKMDAHFSNRSWPAASVGRRAPGA